MRYHKLNAKRCVAKHFFFAHHLFFSCVGFGLMVSRAYLGVGSKV